MSLRLNLYDSLYIYVSTSMVEGVVRELVEGFVEGVDATVEGRWRG